MEVAIEALHSGDAAVIVCHPSSPLLPPASPSAASPSQTSRAPPPSLQAALWWVEVRQVTRVSFWPPFFINIFKIIFTQPANLIRGRGEGENKPLSSAFQLYADVRIFRWLVPGNAGKTAVGFGPGNARSSRQRLQSNSDAMLQAWQVARCRKSIRYEDTSVLGGGNLRTLMGCSIAHTRGEGVPISALCRGCAQLNGIYANADVYHFNDSYSYTTEGKAAQCVLDMAFSGQLPDDSTLPTDVASLQPLLLVRSLVGLVGLVGVFYFLLSQPPKLQDCVWFTSSNKIVEPLQDPLSPAPHDNDPPR